MSVHFPPYDFPILAKGYRRENFDAVSGIPALEKIHPRPPLPNTSTSSDYGFSLSPSLSLSSLCFIGKVSHKFVLSYDCPFKFESSVKNIREKISKNLAKKKSRFFSFVFMLILIHFLQNIYVYFYCNK